MKFATRRLIVFGLLYASYCGYYVCRKNYSFWLAALISETEMTKGQAGAMGSAFEICSGISKFALAIFVDTHNPRVVLAGALFASALVNILMYYAVPNTVSMTLLWGLNGVVQALGWPALALIFMAWYKPEERGRWYSLLSTNQNVGAALVPLMLPPMMSATSWHAALYAPGAVGVSLSALLLLFLEESPANISVSGVQSGNDKDKVQKKEDLSALVYSEVFVNPSIYLLGVCYFSISVIRNGLGDWAIKFLDEEWQLPGHAASKCLLMLEYGGFIGSFAAGYVSDKVFRGRRSPVIGTLSLLCAVPILVLGLGSSMVESSSPYRTVVPQAAYFLLGIFSFAPHVLIGLAAREWTNMKVASTAGGMVKFIAQIGGASAGAPLGTLVGVYGWQAGMKLLATFAAVAGVCMVPVWNRRATLASKGT